MTKQNIFIYTCVLFIIGYLFGFYVTNNKQPHNNKQSYQNTIKEIDAIQQINDLKTYNTICQEKNLFLITLTFFIKKKLEHSLGKEQAQTWSKGILDDLFFIDEILKTNHQILNKFSDFSHPDKLLNLSEKIYLICINQKLLQNEIISIGNLYNKKEKQEDKPCHPKGAVLYFKQSLQPLPSSQNN